MFYLLSVKSGLEPLSSYMLITTLDFTGGALSP